MTLALNLGIGVAMLAFLPLLGYMLYILAREVAPGHARDQRDPDHDGGLVDHVHAPGRLEAVRGLVAGDRRGRPAAVPGGRSLATTVSLFVCAVMSLVTFILRQKSAADTHRHALLRDEDGEGEE